VRVAVDYGRSQLELVLPDARVARVDVLEKRAVPPLPDAAAAVRAALAAPVSAPALRELARGRRDAVIVISDHTRPVPNAVLLPPILEALAEAGIPESAIHVLVATGLHRPSTPRELDAMLGDDLARRLRVVQHDARDADAHADLGTAVHGIPIQIDRFYLERDLKILTGLIEPHLMAGYSGGRKAVCPGLAAVATIRAAHGPALLEGRVGPGLVEGNPLHEALLEVLARAGGDFLVDVALDRQRRIAGVFAGDPVAAHARGMAFVAGESLASLDAPADLVVASAGGHPLDATFYQAIKGIAAASQIVRPGGVILLLASLSEGIGSPSFEKLLRESESPEAFELRLEDDAFFAVDQWMVQHLCQARRRARVLVYTDGLAPGAAGELLVEVASDPAQAVERALALAGPRPRVAVLPQGPYTLATVRGRTRPLGRAGD
jgi:nickel-dependent lactate racemase